MSLELPGRISINLSDHDTVVGWACRSSENVPLSDVAATFFKGVASGRPDHLSCLGSWSHLKNTRPHRFEGWGYAGEVANALGCRRCGFDGVGDSDLDVLELEVRRLNGSTFLCSSVRFWVYDAYRVKQDGSHALEPNDIDAANRVIDDLEHCATRRGQDFKRSDAVREVRAGHKQAGIALSKLGAERLLNSLAASGVLSPRSLVSPFDDHVPYEVRIHETRGNQLSFDYPFSQWTGSDGVNRERFEFLLDAARST